MKKVVKRYKVIYSKMTGNTIEESREFVMPQTAKNYSFHLKKKGHCVLEIREISHVVEV